MKKYVFIAMVSCALLSTVSCGNNGSEPSGPEDSKTSLRIKNATGQNFRELIPPTVITEQAYDSVWYFDYTVKVGDFGFNLDTLANDSLSAYRNSFTEISATKLFTRCMFNCRIYQSKSSYYTVTKDVKDTIDLPEQIKCELGKKYTLILKDLKGNVDFVEDE